MEDYISQVIKITEFNQNKPLNEIVYEGLRNAIIKGIIPVGERINESEYSIRLNISRTPIRDAIRRIEEEGLVEYIPKYGVVVKKVTVEDAEEIFKIRQSLEVLATTNAMKIMTPKEFEEIYLLLEKTEEANANKDVEAVIKYSSDFNDLIYEFARMPRLTIIVTKLREYLARFRDISLAGEDRRRKALDEHWDIYYNMKSKNYDKISSLVIEHLEYAKGFIIREIIKMEERLDGEAYDNRDE